MSRQDQNMKIFVLNCGSSSLKFKLFSTNEHNEVDANPLCIGLIERVGSQAIINLGSLKGGSFKEIRPLKDHKDAINYVLEWIINEKSQSGINSLQEIDGVGHRVVHGGEFFSQSVKVDENVINGIEDCFDLAPLHNPSNLKGIKAITEKLGKSMPQVAVFDTAFHATLPESSYLYALPYQLYRRYKLRRYGFHGTSHRYLKYKYRLVKKLEREQVNILTLHLGSGCSICRIEKGISLDTSMGLTPNEGLVMGTRSGDVDPSVFSFLYHKEGFQIEDIERILNKQSGLLGISGLTDDMRDLIEEEVECQDRRASLAIEIFCKRVRHYIGAYLAESEKVDAIVFSGGIGENSAYIREKILIKLAGEDIV